MRNSNKTSTKLTRSRKKIITGATKYNPIRCVKCSNLTSIRKSITTENGRVCYGCISGP